MSFEIESKSKKYVDNDYDVNDFLFTSRKELIILHCFAIVLHAVSCLLGGLIIRNYDPSVPVIATLFEFVPGTEFIIPKPSVWFRASVLWPEVAVEAITAFFHVIYLIALILPRFNSFIKRYVANTPSANALRWIEYAITSTVMSAFGGISLGMNDAYFFVKTISTGIALQACGYILEILQANNADGTPNIRDRRLYQIIWWVIGSSLNLVSVGLLLYHIFASELHGAQSLFIQNTLPFACWYQTFGFIAQKSFFKNQQFCDRFFCERWYLILSLSTKIAVFWLGFGTFRKIIEDNGVAPRSDVNWTAVRFSAMLVPAICVIAYIVKDVLQWRAHVLKNGLGRKTTKVKMFSLNL